MEKIKKHLPALKKVLENYNVVFAYVFGSAAASRQTKLSDLDIAVFLPESTPKEKYFDLQIELMGKLEKIFKKRIDVLILNNASSLIAQMALVHGRNVFSQNKEEKIRFLTKNLQRFDDALYLTGVSNNYLNKRVFQDKMGERL